MFYEGLSSFGTRLGTRPVLLREYAVDRYQGVRIRGHSRKLLLYGTGLRIKIVE